MKIGILTFFGTLNFGVNMQGVAVYSLMKNKYPNAEIEMIDLRNGRCQTLLLPYKSNTSLSSILRDFVRIMKFKDIRKKVLKFSKQTINTENYTQGTNFISKQNYDLVVVGSDTCLEFNKKFHFDENIPYYWLSTQIHSRKIFISPSSRNLKISDLNEIQKAKLKHNIENFEYLGVRDNSTYSLIKSLMPNNIDNLSIIPDPTFAYDIDYKYADDFAIKKNINESDKNVLIHLYKNEPWEKSLVILLKKKGYTVYSIRPSKFVDFSINDIGPLENAGIYKYFKLVITHRFHDSVFCFKNRIPVVTYYSKLIYSGIDGHSKYSDLFSQFGYEDVSLINSDEGINENIIESSIEGILQVYDKDKVDEKLAILKNTLIDYLSKIA